MALLHSEEDVYWFFTIDKDKMNKKKVVACAIRSILFRLNFKNVESLKYDKNMQKISMLSDDRKLFLADFSKN